MSVQFIEPVPAKPYPGFSFFAAQPYSLLLRGNKVQARCRRTIPVPTEEVVILQYLAHFGGRVEASVLGWALGFALRDEFTSKPYAYRDPAEVSLWDELLKQLAAFGLVRLKGGLVMATQFSYLAIQQRVKYQYFTAECCYWQFAELTAPTDFPFPDFGYKASLTAEQIFDYPEQVEDYGTMPMSGALASARWQLAAAGLTRDVDVLEILSENHRYPQSGSLAAMGYCYRLDTASSSADAPDYRVTVSIAEQTSVGLTTVLNAAVNLAVRQDWGHRAEYTTYWQNPNAIFTADQLLRFQTDWNWALLLPDPRLAWNDIGVLPTVVQLLGHSEKARLTASVPVMLLRAQVEEFHDNWDWSVLSARLDDEFITSHLAELRDEELSYPWDFTVLSQREPAVVEGWLIQLLHAGWAEQLVSGETFNWDWPALAERLSEAFLLAHLAVLPFSRRVLLARGTGFLEAALRAEIEGGQLGAWDRRYLLDNLSLSFIWQHLMHLAGYLPWHELLGRLLAPDQPAPAAEAMARLRVLIQARREDINPLTTQLLAWSPDLINFFDEQGLLQWASTASQPGFEQHPALAWSPTYFARYHSRVRTPQGATFVSHQLTDLSIVVQYPEFAWDWAAISANERLSWTRELTARYRDRIVWSRLLRRFGADEVSRRLPALHAQLTETRPEALPDLWQYANDQLPVAALLSWTATYSVYLNRSLLSRRDPAAVAAYLLREADFGTEWDWTALAQGTPPDLLAPLLEIADSTYRHAPADYLRALSRPAAARLPLQFSLVVAPELALPWDWEYVSAQLMPEQLSLHLTALASHVNWNLLARQTAMQPALITTWVLDHQVQPYLPWSVITPLLQVEMVEAHLNDLAPYLDWHYLVRQPAYHTLLLSQLLDHSVVRERLPWDYVLREAIRPTDLAADLPGWSRRLRVLTDPAVRQLAFAAFTQRVPVAAVLPVNSANSSYPEVTPSVLASLPLDWELFSADARLAHQLRIDVLVRYRAFWHWPTLSRNPLLNTNEDYLLHPMLRSLWDWAWISQHSQFIHGQMKSRELIDVLERYASFVRWPLLSLRNDVQWTGQLLRAHRRRPWDWAAISASPMLQLKEEFLLQLQEKPWDWTALSANPALWLSLSSIAQLAGRPWDWAALSANTSITIDPAALAQLAEYPWDWTLLTRHPRFNWTADLLFVLADYPLDWTWLSKSEKVVWSGELLYRTRQYLNWPVISAKPPLPLTAGLLQDLSAYWDFPALSRSLALADLPVPPKGVQQMRNPIWLVHETSSLPWDWQFLSARIDISFTQEVLDILQYKLHWPALSRRQWGHAFKPGWLKRYAGRWDLVALAMHAGLPSEAQHEVLQHIESDTSRILPFLCRLERMARDYPDWAGYAFHCTHLTNAAAIIKSGRLLCRKAVRKTDHRLADASGSINYHPSFTWDYARLYYRPQTFTQFYTEQLGLDYALSLRTDDTTLYQRAESLGFPKCPIPVFFRFRISEILATQPERFFVSDGNMQRSSVSHGPLKNMERRLTIDKLLFHRNGDGWLETDEWLAHKDISQQEILLEHHLDLNPLITIDICVSDHWAEQELIKLIGPSHPLASRIQVESSLFRRNNRQLDCSYSDSYVRVTTDFTDEYDLVLECQTLDVADVSEMKNGTFRRKGHQLIAEKELCVSWPSPTAFRVRFRDKVTSRPGGPREYDLFHQLASD
jgi:hypothetical protein